MIDTEFKKLDKSIILSKYPQKKFTLPFIGYVYGYDSKRLKKEYNKSFKLVQKLVYIYQIFEEFDKKVEIKIKGAQTLYDCVHILNICFKQSILKYFGRMKLDPRVVLYILCTHKRASTLFKLPKEKLEKIKNNIQIYGENL